MLVYCSLEKATMGILTSGQDFGCVYHSQIVAMILSHEGLGSYSCYKQS